MLHTKAVTSKEILYWKRGLQAAQHNSKLGVEYPNGVMNKTAVVKMDGEEFIPNCFPVEFIDKYWVPIVDAALKKRGLPKTESQ